MTGIFISIREMDALRGLPHLQVILYYAIRPFMDYATGIVGLQRGISWQSLGESLYIEPAPGIKGGSPSKDQIRRAADGLERAGLIRFSGQNSASFRLVFKCLLAETDKSAQNKAAIKPPLLAATLEPKPDAETHDIPAIPETAKAATPPRSEIYPIETSSPIETNQGGVGVEFAKLIKPENRAAIEGHLKAARPEDRQALLDDLIGYMSQQSGRGVPVANPAGVLRRMMERYQAGNWQPELAFIGQAIRQREKAQPSAGSSLQPPAAAGNPDKPRISPPGGSLKSTLERMGVKI